MRPTIIRSERPPIQNMLNREQLILAIGIQSQSFQLLRWIGAHLDSGVIALSRAGAHSETPDAAFDWLEQNRMLFPTTLRPDAAHLRQFANFFWTYVTTSFDVVKNPGTLLIAADTGCGCRMCARISNASHLQPKKLTRGEKFWADELMRERMAALAHEEQIPVQPQQCLSLTENPTTRRAAAFSTYGQWLINRLSGDTAGPAILALWRVIAWTPAGSPVRGFLLKYDDFEASENLLIQSLRGMASPTLG